MYALSRFGSEKQAWQDREEKEVQENITAQKSRKICIGETEELWGTACTAYPTDLFPLIKAAWTPKGNGPMLSEMKPKISHAHASYLSTIMCGTDIFHLLKR